MISFWNVIYKYFITGKCFSEALILASTNPQYDKSLFIDLLFSYMKTTSSEQVVYITCFLFWHSKQFMYTTCSELVVFMYRTGTSMNNLLSYCGLIDARISASEKDLPVQFQFQEFNSDFKKIQFRGRQDSNLRSQRESDF